MGAARQKHRHSLGFTVTEIMIAISIIGILASIALVVYPGHRLRAQDAERKNDIGQVAAALSAYALQKNNYVGTGSGCGLNGNGNGWLAAGPGEIAAYPKSILRCLDEASVLDETAFIDPSGCLWGSASCTLAGGRVKAYMKASCQKGGVPTTYVFAYIESEPQKDNEIDALCDSGTVNGFTTVTQKWGTAYGMNYYAVAK